MLLSDHLLHYKDLSTSVIFLRTHGDVPIAVKAMSDMLIKRRKRVSKARVLAFAKRLGTLSLQLLHHGSAACLGLLRQLINTHSATLQLLDSEHEVWP